MFIKATMVPRLSATTSAQAHNRKGHPQSLHEAREIRRYDAVPVGLGGGDMDTIDDDTTRVDGLEAVQHPQQRALVRTAQPDVHQRLPFLDVGADISKSLDRVSTGNREGLGDILDLHDLRSIGHEWDPPKVPRATQCVH
jgi:hypothetical protein